MEHELSKGS